MSSSELHPYIYCNCGPNCISADPESQVVGDFGETHPMSLKDDSSDDTKEHL